MKPGRFSRRALLSTSLLAGAGATAWLGTSSSWTARFVRERVGEWGREMREPRHKPNATGWSDNAITLAWLGQRNRPD